MSTHLEYNVQTGTTHIVPLTPEELAAASAVSVTVNDLLLERSRRLDSGFDYNFDDARGVHHLNTTKADMEGWDEVTKLSTAAILSNKPTTTITLKTATGIVDVTAAEWQDILMVAGSVRQKIYQAYFALKYMDPIPSDFADDVYWS